jgi:hypothetical protein
MEYFRLNSNGLLVVEQRANRRKKKANTVFSIGVRDLRYQLTSGDAIAAGVWFHVYLGMRRVVNSRTFWLVYWKRKDVLGPWNLACLDFIREAAGPSIATTMNGGARTGIFGLAGDLYRISIFFCLPAAAGSTSSCLLLFGIYREHK